MEKQCEMSTVIVDYITARGQEKLEKLDKDIDKLKKSADIADQAKLDDSAAIAIAAAR